jgi:hypothetical protein
MDPMPLSFETLMAYLNRAIGQIKDPRQPSNATQYRLSDVILGAFSAFFMQCESFLEHQRQLSSRCGQDNAQTIFGLIRVPTDAQIRNVMDLIPSAEFHGIFNWVYQALKRGGFLTSYESLGGHLLVTLDGTQYHSSNKVHCDCCSSRTHKNGTVNYFHSAILPVIVSPGKSEVIALAPEFITPQDGSAKQDCEINAAKRWLAKSDRCFEGQPITLLGDDLYSRQPMCETLLATGNNYIFTCLPDSHDKLYEWLDYLERIGEVKTLVIQQYSKKTKDIYHYRYVNQVPLRDSQPALLVNWCELILTRESDGKVLYKNAFITQHFLDEQTVPTVVTAGRCRWKTENESHNVLKTKGYHLEHNFGHGEKHLSATLLTLNLLAFLFHTVLQMVDTAYQKIRQQRGTRKGFFQDILSLTKYLLFEGWQALIEFMLADSNPKRRANSS